MSRCVRLIAATGLVVAGSIAAVVMPSAPTQAAPVICEKFGGTYIRNDFYRVQNNIWGADTAQCIDVNQDGGFTVISADHSKPTNGAPAAYPSIYAGCHWGECTTGSGLPMPASSQNLSNVQTSVSMTYPAGGTWNGSYDIWFDPTPRTDGQNTGAELMIWLNRQGSIQPAGSPVGTVSLLGATWQVWFGGGSWNIVSYVRTSPTSTLDFAVETFYADMVARGYAQRSWYMTSVQAGFEPWIGGAGLAVNSFSYTTGGGDEDTEPPGVPQNLTVTGVSSSTVSMSWNPSTDNVAVAGYDVFRDGNLAATVTGTGHTVTGLDADTPYSFTVRARDAAGNVSAPSNPVSATTEGGGGEGCLAAFTLQGPPWDVGYVGEIRVTNTGSTAISGWTVTFTFGSGQAIVNLWSAVATVSGQNVTATNMSWNGSLAPGGTAMWGYQASKPAASAATVQNLTCTPS